MASFVTRWCDICKAQFSHITDNWWETHYEMYHPELSRAQELEDLHTPLPEAEMVTFDWRAFSARNLRRCTSKEGFNHALHSWSLSDWMTATLGELGEAANVLKKLNRARDGIPGNEKTADDLQQDFAHELADTFIYLDLLAQAAGIDLPSAVEEKFNITSAKRGYVE